MLVVAVPSRVTHFARRIERRDEARLVADRIALRGRAGPASGARLRDHRAAPRVDDDALAVDRRAVRSRSLGPRASRSRFPIRAPTSRSTVPLNFAIWYGPVQSLKTCVATLPAIVVVMQPAGGRTAGVLPHLLDRPPRRSRRPRGRRDPRAPAPLSGSSRPTSMSSSVSLASVSSSTSCCSVVASDSRRRPRHCPCACRNRPRPYRAAPRDTKAMFTSFIGSPSAVGAVASTQQLACRPPARGVLASFAAPARGRRRFA